MICTQCGGKHFHKKGILNGVQQYKCVTRSKEGFACGCRKQPVFVTEEEESEYLAILDENVKLAKKTQKYQDVNRSKSNQGLFIRRNKNKSVLSHAILFLLTDLLLFLRRYHPRNTGALFILRHPIHTKQISFVLLGSSTNEICLV